jgi:TolB protein
VSESTLYVADLTGANSVQLSPSTGAWVGPAFSPDGSRVAFSSYTNCGWRCAIYALYVANADGSGMRQISERGAGASWAPDGTRIVYGDHGHVEVVRLRDGRITRLGQGWNPAWAPRGNRIAFIGYRRGYGVPCFVDPDGRNRRCGRGYSATGRFVWSPDGRRVAFQYSPGFMLAVLGADAKGLRRFRSPGIPTPLAWSPDGRRLAYTHSFEQEIFVRTVAGPSRAFRVTSGQPFYPNDVRWRPGRISYVSRSGG